MLQASRSSSKLAAWVGVYVGCNGARKEGPKSIVYVTRTQE